MKEKEQKEVIFRKKFQDRDQASHLMYVRYNRWFGKLVGCDDEYELDYKEEVRPSFVSSFLKKCRDKPGKFWMIPVERSNDNQDRVEKCTGLLGDRFVPPKDGRPVVLYRRGKTSGCLYCGLASALAYFGDNAKAKEIFNLQKEYDYKDSQWDHVIRQMAKRKTNQYFPVRYEDLMPSEILRKNILTLRMLCCWWFFMAAMEVQITVFLFVRDLFLMQTCLMQWSILRRIWIGAAVHPVWM